MALYIGGEGGIRTPGPFRVNGFQDHRFRPLSHLSRITVASYEWLVGSFPATRPSSLAPVLKGRYHTRIISCFNPIHVDANEVDLLSVDGARCCWKSI